MSLVSIIIPMYNSKDFITATIESVIFQTFTDWELILVDDCSTDGTYEHVSSVYAGDGRIRIIKADRNGGAGVARNIGLENAKGDMIAFLDADDLWHKDKLMFQVEHMQANYSAIVHTSYCLIDDCGHTISGGVKASPSLDLNSYMRTTEIGMSTALVNRSLVGDFRLSKLRTRQDTKLWLELLSKGIVAHGIDRQLVQYRIRKGQISGNKFKIAWRTFKVYMSFTRIPFYKRLINYFFYAINAILKRI